MGTLIAFFALVGVPMWLGSFALMGIHAQLAAIREINQRFALNEHVARAPDVCDGSINCKAGPHDKGCFADKRER